MRRRLDAINENLAAKPDSALVEYLRIPDEYVSPFSHIARRLFYALAALFTAAVVVYLDREGYNNANGKPLTFLDCIYYATVSLSTTGYGDIAPFSERARLLNVLVITPLRFAFLIVLIGTTVETLTKDSRQTIRIQRWRKKMRNHTVVVGYGTKGRTAVTAMLADGVPSGEIVVVDTDQSSLDKANAAGLVTIRGDANKSDVLRLAGAQHAKAIVVCDEDATLELRVRFCPLPLPSFRAVVTCHRRADLRFAPPNTSSRYRIARRC